MNACHFNKIVKSLELNMPWWYPKSRGKTKYIKMKKKLISNQLPEQRALICVSALPEIRYNFWFNSEHFPIWFLLVFNGLFLKYKAASAMFKENNKLFVHLWSRF